MGPPPAVAAVRTAVRHAVRDLVGGQRPRVLVAVSGGGDSLALLAATCFVVPRMGVAVGALTVDHGLTPGSTQRAREVARLARGLGADPVSVWHVRVQGAGGPEAAARRARHEAFHTAAAATGADAVLLAHSRDDQAETVLLGLARGSGTRSLAGMAAHNGVLRRPLLGLGRSTLREAANVLAAERGITVWSDPHNSDPAYARVRVRHRLLPVLEQEIGPGIADALARTAALARDDADALDAWADAEADTALRRAPDGGVDVDAVAVSGLPRAVRSRLLRRAAIAAGSPATDLTAGHVRAMDAMVGSAVAGAVLDLPGVQAVRLGGLLRLTRRT